MLAFAFIRTNRAMHEHLIPELSFTSCVNVLWFIWLMEKATSVKGGFFFCVLFGKFISSRYFVLHICNRNSPCTFENCIKQMQKWQLVSFVLGYEFFRTQPTCHENQKMVFDWLRHSRIVPVYELSLNRDLTNSTTTNH